MKLIATYILLLFFNYSNSQTSTNYEVLNRTDSGKIKTNKSLKKCSRSELYHLRFSKSVATTISKDFFKNIDEIKHTYETSSFKKKDTINYVVYDYILKKGIDINQLKSKLNLGIKDISGYKAPTTCNTFLNDDKITCVCRFNLEPGYLSDEDFINLLKEDTEKRIK